LSTKMGGTKSGWLSRQRIIAESGQDALGFPREWYGTRYVAIIQHSKTPNLSAITDLLGIREL
jgi:hypothetical protein